MALGALLGAYIEDDSGGLRALLPLAGRTLLEYQVRCASAAGAAPIVVMVERVPQALQDAFERLRHDGYGVFPVSDVAEAASRFEAGSSILLMADGVAPPAQLLLDLAEDGEPVIAIVPDDEGHEQNERIDGQSRWAGVAIASGQMLAATAAILGDWDLQSTLLRRAVQEGARRVFVEGELEPLLVETPGQLQAFGSHLVAASRQPRDDWASRFILAPVEELATAHLMDSAVRPSWLLWGALLLTVGAAITFTRGWLGAGLVLLCLSAPLDLIARRLAILRLRPLPSSPWTQRLLWPAAGMALAAIGLWELRHNTGWGALVTALAAAAFAEAGRLEGQPAGRDSEIWLFSRRNAIFLAIPFALAGAWTSYLLAALAYAGGSFFLVQHVRRAMERLTTS
ncbi:NTP transferase domain-containing protein [Sphingomonas sp.]|uniref:NTP transferase domain-containing protein n=1 Tax=Sphingomonas sp. TaxID=28214 RepID=UPI0025D87F20|nr:NTP transferase domain-containing protein [Sphingomonas sp.]MBV9528991.1 NTP transferase domain-containing protein [Sphingomonas sp.]